MLFRSRVLFPSHDTTTASTGEWNPVINSHFIIAEGLSTSEDQLQELADIKARHLGGLAVMKDFKGLWADTVEAKLVDFQQKRASLNESNVNDALRQGESKAYISAQRVLDSIKESTGF